VLNRAGAHAGSVFGRFDDDEIHIAASSGDDSVFGEALYDLTMSFIEHAVRFVVIGANGDANPCDRLCRSIALAAASIAARRTGRSIELFAMTPQGQRQLDADAMSFRLDDSALARKVRAARAYPLLDSDIDRAIAAAGIDGLRTEGFSRVKSTSTAMPCETGTRNLPLS
jgi:hypothetical protein